MGGWYSLVYSYSFNQLRIKILLTYLLTPVFEITASDRRFPVKYIKRPHIFFRFLRKHSDKIVLLSKLTKLNPYWFMSKATYFLIS